MQHEICQVCNLALETGVILQNWKDIKIKLLYKSGCKTDPTNYRGIALLSHASKIFERIILERLTALIVKLDDCIPDTQFGFMKGKGITDALFMSRSLISHGLKVEGYQIFQCFIDLKIAYDVVDRSILWEVLEQIWFTG